MTATSLRRRAPGIILIVAAMLYSVVPLVSMFCAAVAAPGSFPAGLSWPAHPHWHNFAAAWDIANMTTLLKSSILIVAGVVPAGVLISTMAAYAIVLPRIPLGRVFFAVLLLTLVLPYELVVVPLYEQEQSMGILNTRWALILPLIGLNMPFAIFWMRAQRVLRIPIDCSCSYSGTTTSSYGRTRVSRSTAKKTRPRGIRSRTIA
jgi:raffinose/stachyose/melibiose transport system permease protein